MGTTWSSNDWPAAWASLTVPDPPRKKATVVIPAYGGERRLEAILVALSRQTYPPELSEVIIVDDGTEPPLDPAVPPGLDVTLLRQARAGFGAGRARTFGAEAASGDFIVFLDADMVPEWQWLEAHAALHHAHDWLVVCGFRKHVETTTLDPADVRDVDDVPTLLGGQEVFEPAWLLDLWRATAQGRSQSDRVWRTTSSGNLSVSRGVFLATGGFDGEAFLGWGGEDNDFGYRAYQAGAYIVPQPRAMAWHLGLGTFQRPDAEALLDQMRLILGSRVADGALPRPAGLVHHTPDVVVEMAAGDASARDILEAAAATLLAGAGQSVACAIVGDFEDAELVRRVVAPDSRLTVGSTGHGLRRWPAARVLLESPVHPWTAGQLATLAAEIKEGRTSFGRIAANGKEVARATLVRVRNQIRRGLLTEDQAFGHLGGRWLAVEELSG